MAKKYVSKISALSVNFKNVSNCSKGTVLITEAGCQAIKIKKSTLVGDLMQINVVGSR